MNQYRIESRDNVSALFIYDDIGEQWGGITARRVIEDLAPLRSPEVAVHINSLGGDTFEGAAIYNALRNHPARVAVHVDGVAASIASVIAMAGDEINIAENGMLMVHEAWGTVIGTAAEMRKRADVVEKVQNTIVGIYVKRTGKPEQELRDMMAAETWMNADEALANGFVDRVTGALKIAARFDPTKHRFSRLPDALVPPNASAPKPHPVLAQQAQRLRRRNIR